MDGWMGKLPSLFLLLLLLQVVVVGWICLVLVGFGFVVSVVCLLVKSDYKETVGFTACHHLTKEKKTNILRVLRFL